MHKKNRTVNLERNHIFSLRLNKIDHQHRSNVGDTIYVNIRRHKERYHSISKHVKIWNTTICNSRFFITDPPPLFCLFSKRFFPLFFCIFVDSFQSAFRSLKTDGEISTSLSRKSAQKVKKNSTAFQGAEGRLGLKIFTRRKNG